MNTNDKIKRFIELRDKKAAMKKKFGEFTAPIDKEMYAIQTQVLEHMNEQDLQNIKGENGTAYKVKKVSVTVPDSELFFEWVMNNKLFHMLERRASKSAVEEYVTEHGDLPPGLAMTAVMDVNFRKGK